MERRSFFMKRGTKLAGAMLLLQFLFAFDYSYGQAGGINGKITNDKGEALPGATITLLEKMYNPQQVPTGSLLLLTWKVEIIICQ
ncbi:hypothetical protein [Niabella ginsengisoli]|uniref:Carboxypeptidase regulatory-like domain-containing protein n=1 Tax=Niabella ginsengisoli TaxID=522298 RepID=A0ABS9SEE8_9BACT|nr:hypothetical protein [Niabella ginsengisoli]MCH5596733.1 hypothetical protein [Niabella ginsengisoli]